MAKSSAENYLALLKARSRKRRPPNKEQVLAEEIWLYFGKEISFPAILKNIQTKGRQAVYEIFNEVKRAKFPNKPALFLSLLKKEEVVWLNGKHSKSKVKKNGKNTFKHK